MDVSVVIVNWNTRDMLRRCLESIGQVGSFFAYDVYVVDNASGDGSPEMVRGSFPGVHLIANTENLGFARANNQALQTSKGRYRMVLNSDTELRPGSVDALVAFMDAHPRAGAAGPQLLNPDGSLQPSCHPMLTPGREFWRLVFGDRLWPQATYPMNNWSREQARRVEVMVGACMILRAEALAQTGLFDESYFMYTEEVDLCYRLARAGWELWWEPHAHVVHYGAASSRQAAEAMYIQLYRSKVQFYRKFGGPAAADRFKRFLRIAYWPRALLGGAAACLLARVRPQAHTYRRLLDELPRM